MSRIHLSFGIALWLILLGFIFSVPLWSYSSQKAISANFLSTIEQDKAVVFFGFTACGDVCPASMSLLRQLIKHKDTMSNAAMPAVVFIDIDANSDAQQAANYAKGFDIRFIGIHPDKQTLIHLKSQFGLNFTQKDNDIQHMGRTYILEKDAQQWFLVKTVNPQGLSQQWLEEALFET